MTEKYQKWNGNKMAEIEERLKWHNATGTESPLLEEGHSLICTWDPPLSSFTWADEAQWPIRI